MHRWRVSTRRIFKIQILIREAINDVGFPGYPGLSFDNMP